MPSVSVSRRYPAIVAAGILSSSTIFATAALADVTISSDATQNMSCAAGVCAPTATSAVLNVADLEALLASGNVTVTTTGSGVQADNIDVTAKLGWSANALTLDAYQSLSVTAPVTVNGKSGLAILTNDGGSGGELAFSGKGHVTFKKPSGSLSINGAVYRLENSIAALAKAVKQNSAGAYALAKNIDASSNGTYGSSPIETGFSGSFEGLGNSVSNLKIDVVTGSAGSYGFFSGVGQGGQVSDVALLNASVTVENRRKNSTLAEGVLAGANGGTILRCRATGTLNAPKNPDAGGLVGYNAAGFIEQSFANVNVVASSERSGYANIVGGLVGGNGGQINGSYAVGRVNAGGGGDSTSAGGLVGFNQGSVSNSYATGNSKSTGSAGGLIGVDSGDVTTSYSTGVPNGLSWAGGFVGSDDSQSGSLTDDYWDTDTSGTTNLSQGAGNIFNDPGITGLSTEQLQSGLPEGFDPAIWGESTEINGGLPYLLALPPK